MYSDSLDSSLSFTSICYSFCLGFRQSVNTIRYQRFQTLKSARTSDNFLSPIFSPYSLSQRKSRLVILSPWKVPCNWFLAILHLDGSLEDISPEQIYRANFRRFLPSFHFCYRFFKSNIYLFILVFSDPIIFCLFLFLSSIFPVFYFLSFSSVFLCISVILFLLLSLSLPALYLSPLTFFVYHLFFHSAFVSLSLSLSSLFLLVFLLLFFFTCLLLHSPYSFLYFFGYICFIVIILLSFFSCIFYLSFFVCLFCLFFYIFLSLLFFLFCSFFYSL